MCLAHRIRDRVPEHEVVLLVTISHGAGENAVITRDADVLA